MEPMRLRVARIVGWPGLAHPKLICVTLRALFVAYLVLTALNAFS